MPDKSALEAATSLSETTQIHSVPANPLAQTILEYDDVSEKTMVVPEWGDLEILVRSLTIKESAKFLTDFQGKNTGHLEPVIYLVSRGVCDPATKERIFRQDIATRGMLADKNPVAMGNIARAIMVISGLGTGTTESQDKAGAQAEKN